MELSLLPMALSKREANQRFQVAAAGIVRWLFYFYTRGEDDSESGGNDALEDKGCSGRCRHEEERPKSQGKVKRITAIARGLCNSLHGKGHNLMGMKRLSYFTGPSGIPMEQQTGLTLSHCPPTPSLTIINGGESKKQE